MQALLGGKSCFSNTNGSNQSLFLRYTAKNFSMLFQLVLTKFFKIELFSCLVKVDHVVMVMQRAYYE